MTPEFISVFSPPSFPDGWHHQVWELWLGSKRQPCCKAVMLHKDVLTWHHCFGLLPNSLVAFIALVSWHECTAFVIYETCFGFRAGLPYFSSVLSFHFIAYKPKHSLLCAQCTDLDSELGMENCDLCQYVSEVFWTSLGQADRKGHEEWAEWNWKNQVSFNEGIVIPRILNYCV